MREPLKNPTTRYVAFSHEPGERFRRDRAKWNQDRIRKLAEHGKEVSQHELAEQRRPDKGLARRCSCRR